MFIYNYFLIRYTDSPYLVNPCLQLLQPFRELFPKLAGNDKTFDLEFLHNNNARFKWSCEELSTSLDYLLR